MLRAPVSVDVRDHKPQMRFILTLVVMALHGYVPFAAASSCGFDAEVHFDPGIFSLTAAQKAEIVRVFEKVEKATNISAVWTVAGADPSEAKTQKEVFELSVRRADSIRDYVSRIRPEFKGKIGVDLTGSLIHPAGSPLNRFGKVVVTCPSFMAPR